MYFKILIFLLIFINLANARVQGYNYGFEERDNSSIMDSTLPMPKDFRTKEKPTPHLKYPQDSTSINKLDSVTPLDVNIKSSIQNKLKKEKPDSKDPNILYKSNDEEIEDIDYRIHELQKEKYMLESKIYFKEQDKIGWSANVQRSGYYVGGGIVADFVLSSDINDGIKVIHTNKSAIVKLGFVRYNNNNLGLKIEAFNIFGLTRQSGFFDYLGVRFSVVHDIRIFGKNNYLGYIMGLGLGYGFLSNDKNIGANLHLGLSLTLLRHHRFEIERIMLDPLNPLIGPIDYLNNYVVSYSFIF